MTSNHNTRSRLAVGLMSAPEVDINFISGFESNGPRHFEAGSLESRLLIEPASADSVFEVGGITIGVGFHWQQRQAQRFAGAVELVPDGDNIVVINHVDVEDYLCSVISSEMNANSPLEFLKAHAVISRSWVLRQIGNRHTEINDTARCGADEIIRWYDREDHTLFDVCADDHCQRYQGVTRVTTPMRKALPNGYCHGQMPSAILPTRLCSATCLTISTGPPPTSTDGRSPPQPTSLQH